MEITILTNVCHLGVQFPAEYLRCLLHFLEWLVRDQTNLQTVHHYLDDFILIGKPNTNQCNFLMSTFQEICNGVGVPLNEDKTIQPTNCLIFLGLEIDTVNMQIRIPQNKVRELANLLLYWVSK